MSTENSYISIKRLHWVNGMLNTLQVRKHIYHTEDNMTDSNEQIITLPAKKETKLNFMLSATLKLKAKSM